MNVPYYCYPGYAQFDINGTIWNIVSGHGKSGAKNGDLELDKLKIITLELGRADYQLTILHCGDNYSYGEIAKKLNLTRQTVARRMKVSLGNLYYIFNQGIVR